MGRLSVVDAVSMSVREMRLGEVDIRVKYFHDATDEYLLRLGVDRRLLPDPDAWRAFHFADYARPLHERENYLLAWELDGRLAGFSSLDHIAFGEEAFMHLHVLDPADRMKGLGTGFVKKSAEVYFRLFELKQLFSEPNALNVPPNRTLQRAGFTYLFSHEATPGPINFKQVSTRWVLKRND